MSEAALLVLEDGTLWHGVAFGARGEQTGEVVFNTSMTGYQEVLTDPSYYGQIVVMTTAHIGNTGVNREDDESARVWLAGFCIREASLCASNWRAEESLDGYLQERGVIGIAELDTRALVRHLRSEGAMRGALSNSNPDPTRLLELARSSPRMSGCDLVRYVTCTERYTWFESVSREWLPGDISPHPSPLPCGEREPVSPSPFQGEGRGEGKSFHVVAFDFGIKRNSLRSLVARGCRVTVVPATAAAEDVLALAPDGVLLSNGPGDPAAVRYAIATVRQLLGRVPIFGICLGHQILALALGGETYKLKFGHRGGNHPVKDLRTGQVQVSAHNHGFAVRAESLPRDAEVTHVNLNDGCVEGLRTLNRRAFSVQYHPEAAPGPHDSLSLFDEFLAMMERN